ncbi:hypothetical protein K1T71_014085 [Dendrolimus kikuchii]|uniref:Uncharacterized protein n=1 Tax=Dendrolimus kikuchii TaxID=765133 RepID=A0ACC1CF76_9NEOP|nr:hypothetical protein K1T71_014085 [Dendrolimus kikuchii]
MYLYLCLLSVPQASSENWESFVHNNKEYLIQNLPVNWENAKILCRGYHNGTLAILETKEAAEFLAEALSESQFSLDSVWVGARRDSAEDPAGYRWNQGLELRRTALDIITLETEGDTKHYPVWLNRTHIPVPEGGADCVALERVAHDKPVFLDLPCSLERAFACERDTRPQAQVAELKTIRCRAGLYHVYDGRVDWNQAAAYCALRRMSLANIASLKCLKKLGMTMLKTRPSIENAWIGARGSLGRWTWVDSGVNIFSVPALYDALPGTWPPMRDPTSIKQSGCLQLDRHSSHAPVFLEARCERKMQFICYQVSTLRTSPVLPSDDLYYYVLVKQLLYWQHAFENCQKMNGTLARLDNNDVLVQLLLLMGENKEEPVEHIWISGRLNMTKDVATETTSYAWFNPSTGKRIPDSKSFGDSSIGYMPPWLDEDFTMDSPCLNLDRQDHLNGLVYGLPCDTPQYSICMIEKTTKPTNTGSLADGFESS